MEISRGMLMRVSVIPHILYCFSRSDPQALLPALSSLDLSTSFFFLAVLFPWLFGTSLILPSKVSGIVQSNKDVHNIPHLNDHSITVTAKASYVLRTSYARHHAWLLISFVVITMFRQSCREVRWNACLRLYLGGARARGQTQDCCIPRPDELLITALCYNLNPYFT